MPNIGDIIRASDLIEILESISSSSTGIIGEIIGFPGNSAPKGTLICDGSEISREAYSELFAVIGTNNGEGDGSTTFNIPDLRDKWIKYAGTENSVGEILTEGLPNITGSFQVKAGASASDWAGSFFAGESITSDQYGGTFGRTNVTQFSAQRSSAIYGASTHVTPVNQALNFFIKAKEEV